MIGLYKDPKGENVFSDTHTGDVASAGIVGSLQLQRGTAFGTEDTLRKRIKELEGILSTYQVRVAVQKVNVCHGFIYRYHFKQSNENVLTVDSTEGLGANNGSSMSSKADRKHGTHAMGKDVTVTTV